MAGCSRPAREPESAKSPGKGWSRMLLRLAASSVSAAGLTYFTRSARSRSTTAVASQSSPGEAAGFMRWTRFGNWGPRSAAHACRAAPSERPPAAQAELLDSWERRESPLFEATELAAKLLDILRVLADFFLVWLQSFQHPSVVPLVAFANSFLFGEFLAGIGKQLLFVLELRLEDLAAILAARERGVRCAWGLRGPPGDLRRHNGHFLAHQSAFLADRVALDIR